MFSFLNFFEIESPNPRGRTAPGKGIGGPKEQWRSDSTATSPMSSSTSSPAPPLLYTPPPKKMLVESPEARETEICPTEGVKLRQSVRNKRRSSVFFKLPELGKVRNAPVVQADRQLRAGQSCKASGGLRRSRRASIAPGGGSPRRTRQGNRNARKAAAAGVASCAAPWESATAPASATTTEGKTADRRGKGIGESEERWRNKPRGEAPGARGGKSSAAKPSPAKDLAKPSSRALSAGHRRQSCRTGGISRLPKGLSAAQLLEDALDVARIRSEAGLRSTYQGVCWIASNWCVGGKNGVLSGKRFLVLCDNIVWAELRESGRASGAGDGGEEVPPSRQAGFLPIISMDRATTTIQHCEVANSNNGWIIEVVNPDTNVTLWLDPDNPASLLRWGSVFCQALVGTKMDE